MKKLLSTLLSGLILFSLVACGDGGSSNGGASVSAGAGDPATGSSEVSQQPTVPAVSDDAEYQQESDPPDDSETPSSETTGADALVVYFSATGNTKGVAEVLAELQGADLYEILPEQPYTDEDLNYSDPSTRASVEQYDDTARPAIVGEIGNIDDYGVIYVGFPIWWGDMPRILWTFFDAYDLSGKVIAPFCTSGSSGISGAVQSIAALAPNATVTDGLRVSATAPEDELIQWLNAVGLAAQGQ